MKYFIDFEATRFSNRIISIGCISENGETFQTLVKPVHKAKVDKFITELTGITPEMVAAAPSADEAFNQLFDYVELTSDGTEPQYFCYGHTDVSFIQSTVKYMTDARACILAQAIAGNLVDYSEVVKKFFLADQDIALNKVYRLIHNDIEFIQKHNALEDAEMLRDVVMNLYSSCKPRDKETILTMPSQRVKKRAAGAPERFVAWNDYRKWEAPTIEDGNLWVLRCTDNQTGNVKYFDDYEIAALWVIKYIANNISPKNKKNINRVVHFINSAIAANKSRYGCKWEYNAEGAIAAAARKE